MELETILRKQTILRKPRGFETLTLERRREVAALGGRAAHKLGKAHKWTSEEAQRAGRIGGKISRRRKRLVTSD